MVAAAVGASDRISHLISIKANLIKAFHGKFQIDMYLSNHKTTSSDGSAISFPVRECWNPMTKVATITAEVDKRRVLCRISIEVLQEHFNVSVEEPLRAVAENRSTLQAKSRMLIANEAFEEDGSIIIRSKDI